MNGVGEVPSGDEGPGPAKTEFLSRLSMPSARMTGVDRMLAECGLISGPLGVVKHAGSAGLRIVGLEGNTADGEQVTSDAPD